MFRRFQYQRLSTVFDCVYADLLNNSSAHSKTYLITRRRIIRQTLIYFLFVQLQVALPRSPKIAIRQKPSNWTYFPIPPLVSLSNISMLSFCLSLSLLHGVLLGILGTKLHFHYKCLEIPSAYTSYTAWYSSHFHPELHTTDKFVYIVRDLWDTDSRTSQSQACCLDKSCMNIG